MKRTRAFSQNLPMNDSSALLVASAISAEVTDALSGSAKQTRNAVS